MPGSPGSSPCRRMGRHNGKPGGRGPQHSFRTVVLKNLARPFTKFGFADNIAFDGLERS
ncbi:hypothetical protein CBM2586_A11274 [Cupriavidus phytorum]|uniref:Uncharacterized protein n=1 Tax=Cupriavidus taiwanensis TaxID=164546 RepID=A0A975WSA6_9BURK|nr:hypothetical protein CBM2586_A11274 [Cupriavidus taiwanensis]